MATFVLAGLETTAASMAWFVFYMKHYSEVEAKLYKEIDDVLGGKPIGSFSVTEIGEKLPYFNSVQLAEVLALICQRWSPNP
jgi:cytochrome P450